MSLITILETLLIGPLKLVFEIIFQLANKFIGHPGLAIIVLSLIMNILVLPLYKRADAMQEQARDIENKLHDGVAHIKKTFSGDERMMILQTYYRQNNYKPTDALNGSVSLLLEIPFFMAAYQFLSHLDTLNGISLGPIQDLSAPDGLLVIGGLAVNLLPVLMTLVNVISSAIYLKGFPLKTKIQLYGMAMFFLVFLYASPSGLVFYWTLNNVFSLVKTIFYKLKNPRKVLRILTSVIGLAFLVFGLFFYGTPSQLRRIFVVTLGLLLQLPMILSVVMTKLPQARNAGSVQPNRKLFTLGCLFLTVLIGLLIPSTFIAASPQEYVDVTYFHNPLWYIVSSTCLAAGFFLVWMGVFYWLATPKGKVFFERIVWILCGVMLVNYMFFGTNLGIISATLQYETGMFFSKKEQLLNLLVLAALTGVMYFIIHKWSRAVGMVLVTAVIALGGMSAVNMVTINRSINQISLEQYSEVPHFELSKEGQNVVVLLLDRSVGSNFPYLLQEKPELAETFDGFTYYANTISYGGFTNFGTPPLLGGYEYTPVELNRRSDESLASKHNEALKVMPVLFSENDYNVTVCEPPYAGYQWTPDLSIFDDYPEINTYITQGQFSDVAPKEAIISNNHRNFFVFSAMKTIPLCLQFVVYDGGNYNQASSASAEDLLTYSVQTADSPSKSIGIDGEFMDAYNILSSLPSITQITEGDDNTFLFFYNELTHSPMLLQEPDYAIAQEVDNTEYDAAHADRFTIEGITLRTDDVYTMSQYHTNMKALLLVGEWLDYLRANDVYDNTRIIIVSDHGHHSEQIEELIMSSIDDEWDRVNKDAERFFPLLLVKDFGSTGFTTSTEFMTNADVPTLATNGLIEDPRNPFTGKAINSDEKTAHDQFIILDWQWDVTINNGNTFLPSDWGRVHDNLWDPDNWAFLDDFVVLTEHSFD